MATQQHSYIFGIYNEGVVFSFDPVEYLIKTQVIPENMNINSWSSVVGVDDDEIYVTGGLNQTGKVISAEAFIYKPLSEQVLQRINIRQVTYLPQMKQVRYVHASLMKDGKLFVLGGRHYGPDFESVLSHCEVYENEKWKVVFMPPEIAPMSKRRSNFSAFIYNGMIHVIGGFDGRKHTKSMEVYDENKNVWKKLHTKLPRGLAGMQVLSIKPHEILVVGGITQQGPTASCFSMNLKNKTILSQGSMLEARTLPLVLQHQLEIIIIGGNSKSGSAETIAVDSCLSKTASLDTGGDVQVQTAISGGLRGFAISHQTIHVESFGQQVIQQNEILESQDTALLIGNDEFPFILAISRLNENQQQTAPNLDSNDLCYGNGLRIFPIPQDLRLLSYMSSTLIENDGYIKKVFLGGGIDSRITNISKRAFVVTVDLNSGDVQSKQISKLQYHRYASSCVYKDPYIYIIGGRGYQNDQLSLHNTVERYHIETEQWEQVPPLSEAKCSTAASVINERIYVFGGYVGESKISSRIECLNEGFLEWQVMNVKLPFALEGLSAIKIDEEDIIIVGGKGENGSRREIIRYNWKTLEDDYASEGTVIGQMEHCRSLPKTIMIGQGELMVFGGQFYDNPEISFCEVLNINDQAEHSSVDYKLPSSLEIIQDQFGGAELLGMFIVIQQ